jgi:hypothetical protein
LLDVSVDDVRNFLSVEQRERVLLKRLQPVPLAECLGVELPRSRLRLEEVDNRSLVGGAAALAGVLAGGWLPSDPVSLDRPSGNRVARALARSRRLPVRSATFPVGPARVYWLTRSLHPRAFVKRVSPALALYFLAVVLFFAGFGVFWGPLPLYLSRTLGYDDGVIFGLYLVSSLGAALFYGLSGRLAESYDAGGLQTGSLVARAALHPLVAVVGTVVSATALSLLVNGVVFALIGVAWAVIAVTAASLVTRLAPAAVRGEALGLYTAVSGLASGVGSVLGGWLGGYGFVLAFAVAGALVFGGAVLVAVVWRRSPEATAGKEAASTAL